MTKIPKLMGTADFIRWLRRLYAFIGRHDFDLLGFSKEPRSGTVATNRKWLEAMVKAKSATWLNLGAGPLAQSRSIADDDDQTSKDLWDSITTLYTTSNTQVVINLQSELDQLRFKESEEFEKPV